MAQQKLRGHFSDYLGSAEVVIYTILAVLLFITALATIGAPAKRIGRAPLIAASLQGLCSRSGKNADPEIPILIAAKSEYAKLP